MPGGDYVETTWVNGTTPAINAANLNNIEDKVTELDEQLRRSQVFALRDYLKYFYDRNTKEIAPCDDETTFTSAGTVSLSDDYTNTARHRCGIKLSETDTTGSYLAAYKTVSSMDLTVLNSGDSDGGGYIIWSFYISDAAKFSKVTLKLGDDNNNCFAYDATSLSTGWNYRAEPRSDFTTNNTPSGWDDITYIRLECLSENSASGEYVTFDSVMLYRQYDLYGEPFSLDDGSGNWDDSPIYISVDVDLIMDRKANKLGLQIVQPLNYLDDVELLCTKTNFVCKFDWIVKKEDNLTSMNWYIDSDNYISIYISSGTAYLYANESASGAVQDSTALPSTLEKEQSVKVYFEKTGAQVRAILYFENMQPIYLEYETSITDAGCILLGGNTSSAFGLLTDFVVGHQQGLKTLKESNGNRIVVKERNQPLTTTTLTDDNELYMDFEPNSIYEVEALILINASSDSPDFKCAWTVTGDIELVGQRLVHGHHPNLGSGNFYDSGHIRYSWIELFTTSINYCHNGGAYYGPVIEKFIIRTSSAGGRIQFQFAQNASSAFAVAVKPGSCIKAIKLN